VVAADQAEHTRLDHRFQLLQRLIKQVVLHHPELKTSPLSFVGHALRAREVIGKGLLQIDVPALRQTGHDDLLVERRRQQQLAA